MSFNVAPDSPPLIMKPGGLKQLAEMLSRQKIVAVDTESNSLYAYREQVCLIQFSTVENDYLVDPLALENLSALEPIFTEPGIEKVFHAAEYDLFCLKRDFDLRCEQLFDTMIAASVLGRDEVGLGNLLETEFGVQLDKQYQRANWGQRPLPSTLLAYARLDTHYLIPLRDRLKVELEDAGRWPLAEEEFRRVSLATSREHTGFLRSTSEMCWRISGASDLSPQQAAVLLELCRYRDQVAASLNRPLFKVIGDATLLGIAQLLPKGYDELRRVAGMSRVQMQRHGRNLLAAVQRGLQAEPAYMPRSPRPSDDILARLEGLKQWRKGAARELGVKSDMILSRDLMFAIAQANPRDWEQLRAIMADVPWRLEQFGGQILKVVGRENHRSAR